MPDVIPLVLFVYNRPEHLSRTLTCLKEAGVQLLYVFADGVKGSSDLAQVRATRAVLRKIDWCKVIVTERSENLGLGRNIITGICEIAEFHEAFVVWEDDLICSPHAYNWICAGLRHYVEEERVMSITAWTHPRVTPADVMQNPYFDGRAECWGWGTWARSWKGMQDQTATEKMHLAQLKGISKNHYGADLPRMAAMELTRNIWAVRWLYHHIHREGICLRPPWSLVEHIGFGSDATNAMVADGWNQSFRREPPQLSGGWPAPREHPECARLWRKAYPSRGRAALIRLVARFRRAMRWRD